MGSVPSFAEKLHQLARHDSLLWRQAMVAGVTRGPYALVRYSPPLWGLAFAAILAEQRAVVRRTLRLVLGPRPAWQELRDVGAVFANFACSMTDAMLVGSGRGYTPSVSAVAPWHFTEALALGKGMVMATAHTAGWDLGGPILSGVQPADVLVVMESERAADARELQDSLRRRAGVHIAHVGADPLSSLPLLHHLRRRRGVVAMKFDRVPPTMRSRPVRFFGTAWRVAEGPLGLAALTGAPIVPVFTRRTGFLEYQCIIMPHIMVPPKPTQAELDEGAQRLASALERFVRAYPTSWFRFSEA
jgi:lauroyl/myristoyl acyltransferase